MIRIPAINMQQRPQSNNKLSGVTSKNTSTSSSYAQPSIKSSVQYLSPVRFGSIKKPIVQNVISNEKVKEITAKYANSKAFNELTGILTKAAKGDGSHAQFKAVELVELIESDVSKAKEAAKKYTKVNGKSPDTTMSVEECINAMVKFFKSNLISADVKKQALKENSIAQEPILKLVSRSAMPASTIEQLIKTSTKIDSDAFRK